MMCLFFIRFVKMHFKTKCSQAHYVSPEIDWPSVRAGLGSITPSTSTVNLQTLMSLFRAISDLFYFHITLVPNRKNDFENSVPKSSFILIMKIQYNNTACK